MERLDFEAKESVFLSSMQRHWVKKNTNLQPKSQFFAMEGYFRKKSIKGVMWKGLSKIVVLVSAN